MKMLPPAHQHIRFYRLGCDVYLIFLDLCYTTRFIYALKFAVAMTIAIWVIRLYVCISIIALRLPEYATLGRANWCLYVYCRIVIDGKR